MKPCLICSRSCAVDSHTCPLCGCADFGPAHPVSVPPSSPKPGAAVALNDAAESPAADSAHSAPSPAEPAKRRR